MRINHVLVAMTVGAFSFCTAGELTVDVAAKLLKAVVTGTGGKVACRDSAMKAALESNGVATDATAKVVWVSNAAEAKMLKASGKLLVGGRQELLGAGAGVILVEEGGKPKILLNKTSLTASGVTLSDTILKVGESI